jgi:ATP-dependent Clp protease ATP-binding subunit ClpA
MANEKPKPDGLTPRAKAVLKTAKQEAARLGQSRIGTEHLLLALLSEGGGIAARVLDELGKSDEIRSRIYELALGPTIPGYAEYQRPWSSAIVHDSRGQPKSDEQGRLQQYFVDRNGQPVRSKRGRLLHVSLDSRGRPLLDEGGKPVLIEIDPGEEAHDHLGNSLGG